MNKEQLMSSIQALSFAKLECELFLDTHPDCRAALDYYNSVLNELRPLVEEYEDKFGPLTSSGVSGEKWSWISGPWPWQTEYTEPNKKSAGGGKS